VKDHEALEPLVVKALARDRNRFGLGTGIRARYRLNPGGFVNANFSVTDGRRSLHLKLTGVEGQSSLRRWSELEEELLPYHAPRILGWLEVPSAGLAGLVFERFEGGAFARRDRERVLPQLARAVRKLHRDSAVLRRMPEPEQSGVVSQIIASAVRDALRATPPFVGRNTLAWLRREERSIQRELRELASPLAPIHGDLWAGNVLVGERGWRLIDWDDLRAGDPAEDWASLVLMAGGGFDTGLERLGCKLDAGTRERARVFHRAQVFSQAVDAIADWIEADVAPSRALAVRSSKERQFDRWVRRYRRMFGVGAVRERERAR
jgi:aminoglycoside phosphotransferase (APT) family kinase protein